MDGKPIIEQWRESLGFFKKDSFKLFLLVSLNTLRRSLLSVFNAFPLPLIAAVVSAFALFLYGSALVGSDEFLEFSPVFGRLASFSRLMFWLLHSLLVVVAVLFTRSSTERKDSEYCKKYLNRTLVLLLFVPVLYWPKALYFLCDLNPSLRAVPQALLRSIRMSVLQLPIFIFLISGHILLTFLALWLPTLLRDAILGSQAVGYSLLSVGGFVYAVASLLLWYVIPTLVHIGMIFFIYSCFATVYDRLKYADHQQFFE